MTEDVSSRLIDYKREMSMTRLSKKADVKQVIVCGCPIEYDKSGVGHCWVAAVDDGLDCPSDIQDEISGEIIDGKADSCDVFRAINGVHYRW